MGASFPVCHGQWPRRRAAAKVERGLEVVSIDAEGEFDAGGERSLVFPPQWRGNSVRHDACELHDLAIADAPFFLNVPFRTKQRSALHAS